MGSKKFVVFVAQKMLYSYPCKKFTFDYFCQNMVASKWKVSKYEVFFDPCFPVFGLTTEIYCIQSEYRKIRTTKTSVFGYFFRGGYSYGYSEQGGFIVIKLNLSSNSICLFFCYQMINIITKKHKIHNDGIIVSINPVQDQPFQGYSWMRGEGDGGDKKASPLKSVKRILQWWNLAQLYLT